MTIDTLFNTSLRPSHDAYRAYYSDNSERNPYLWTIFTEKFLAPVLDCASGWPAESNRLQRGLLLGRVKLCFSSRCEFTKNFSDNFESISLKFYRDIPQKSYNSKQELHFLDVDKKVDAF